MFCSEVPIRDTHKSPKIVCWLADTVRGGSKLGKTRIITDASCGMVRKYRILRSEFAAACLSGTLGIYFL